MILGFAHPGLVVTDLEAASRFYQRMFGFEVISKEGWKDSPEMDRAVGLKNSSCRGLMMKGHNCFLELFEFDSSSSQEKPVTNPAADQPGIRHLAFYVDDCKAEYQRLKDLGGIALGEPAGDDESGYAVYCRDPFGNIIELAEIPGPAESPLRLPGVNSLGQFTG
jgi:catechol 2,3-dioxygenase-like lactoylglutathione lyase family enzyme